MKKFLAITATASLVTAFASSVQAQPLPVAVGGGTVIPVCTISANTLGSIGPNSAGTKIGTPWGTNPEMIVICNSATNTVEITGATITNSSTAIPNTYLFNYGFGGGNGIYTAIPNNYAGNSTFTATGTTQSVGDKFKLNAQLEAPGNSLLLAGTYTTTINLQLTP